MELLFILGLLAVVLIVAVGLLLFLQQRRAGTIRAVMPPRHVANDDSDAGDNAAAQQ